MVEVTVLFFAQAKDITQCSSRKWTVGDDWTTSDLQITVLDTFPKLEEVLRVCAWAVNEEYSDGPVLLKDGDQIALIPPISGG